MAVESSKMGVTVTITHQSGYDLTRSGDLQGNDPVRGPSHPVLHPGQTDSVKFSRDGPRAG
jgi:hypothetical protein